MNRFAGVRRSLGVVRDTVTASVPTVLLLLSFVLVSQTARAQSIIFNIPSTDTVDKGKNYFEFDFLAQAPGPDLGASTQIFNPRFIIGLPKNAEFGINVPIYHNSDASPTSLSYIQPNLKVKVYKDDKMGAAATVGVITNFPLNSTDAQLPWALVYGNFSKKVGKAGPRFTVGPYGVIAKQDDPKKVSFLGTRGGVLLGYEQPLAGKVSFVADWFSGKNGVGYFTPGVSIALPHNGLFNAGYSIGNDSWENSNATKNRYLFFYYGVTFP
jgi:hypothetical protein